MRSAFAVPSCVVSFFVLAAAEFPFGTEKQAYRSVTDICSRPGFPKTREEYKKFAQKPAASWRKLQELDTEIQAGHVGANPDGVESDLDYCAADFFPPNPYYKMEPAYTKHEIQIGTFTRTFFVYIPQAVKDKGVAKGIMTHFHGAAGTPSDICGLNHGCWLNWACDESADKYEYIAVVPQGVDTVWNAGYCCIFLDPNPDDIQFYVDMQIQLRDNILPAANVAYPTTNRFAVGHSTGGAMSYYLACNPTSVDYVDGISGWLSTFDDSFDIGPISPYGQACKDDPLLGKSVFSAAGSLDIYFPPGFEKDKWTDYSIHALGCDPNSEQVDTLRSNAVVTCRYFSKCPNGFKSEFCFMAGIDHGVFAEPTRAKGGSDLNLLHTAWEILSGEGPAVSPVPAYVASNGAYAIAAFDRALYGALLILFVGRSLASQYF
jgi:hypothetical protein